MRITNNIMALNTFRQYTINNDAVSKSVSKLSSGYRINSAADDAAGLAISEKMRAQIRGLDMASKNSEDAISLTQTAEGALTETQTILQRMRELSVQSSSDTNQDTVDRQALNSEFTQLTQEIDDIASKTKFNNMSLLDGSFGLGVDKATSTLDNVTGVTISSVTGAVGEETFTFADDGTNLTVTDSEGHTFTGVASPAADGTVSLTSDDSDVTISLNLGASYVAKSMDGKTIVMDNNAKTIQTGANAGDTLTISIGNMSAAGLGVSTASVDTRAHAQAAITTVDNAINLVSNQRAYMGALENRLQYKIENLATSSENLTAAESRIRDVDMAQEMTNYTKANILVQASTAMLAQANSAPQNVLSLLKG